MLQFLDGTGELPDLAIEPFEPHHQIVAATLASLTESLALRLRRLGRGSYALAAAKELGAGTRVVSMPCMERFNREAEEYREEVLPKKCRRRVAIEAGVPEIWYQYVGLDGKVIGLHRFGLSAPGAEVMKEFGIDAQHVIDAARSLS